MAEPSPVEVGARGTIASLMSQEIEYLRSLKLDHNDFSKQRQDKVIREATTSGGSGHTSGSSRMVSKNKKKTKKKVAGTGGFLPSICSAVDVTGSSKAEKITGIGYRNLRTDAKKLADE